MCPTYDYLCNECEGVTTEFVRYEARDRPIECMCGGVAERAFLTPPQIRTPKTSASFLDGTKRFEELKIQDRLERARANARPAEKKEIDKELDAREAKAKKR